MTTQDVNARLEFLLVANGEVRLRFGERRSEATARKMIRDAASSVGVEVKTTKDGSAIVGVVKG